MNMARLVAALCPRCGAGVKIDPAQQHVTCAYCGTSALIQEEGRPRNPRSQPPRGEVIYVRPDGSNRLVRSLIGASVAIVGGLVAVNLATVPSSGSPPKSSAGAPPALNQAAHTQAPPESSPAVSLAAPVLEAGAPLAGAEGVVAAMRTGIRTCYVQALSADGAVHGVFTLRIQVAAGSTRIDIDSSELPPRLLDCIKSSTRAHSFAAPAQGTSVLRVDGSLEVGSPPSPPASPCRCAPGDPLCACP